MHDSYIIFAVFAITKHDVPIITTIHNNFTFVAYYCNK